MILCANQVCMKRSTGLKWSKFINIQRAITCSKLTIETLEQSCEVCSKLTIKPPKRGHWRRFCSFIDKFEHISHLCSSVSIVNFEQVNAGWEYSATNAELQTQVKIFVFISSS